MTTYTLVELFADPFVGLICDEFRFNDLRCIQDESCISLPSILHVPNGGDLALTLRFNCKVSGLRTGDRLNLAITNFRITAQPVDGQQTIVDEHGPSIHINRNTGWGRQEKLNQLLQRLRNDVGENGGPAMEDLLSALNYNLSRKSMPKLVDEWKEKIELQARRATGMENITFGRSDKTFLATE